MIDIVFGGPGRAFQLELTARLAAYPELRITAATAELGRFRMLVANRHPSLVVLDSAWVQACPDLLGMLASMAPPPRVLLYADSLATPAALAAVEQGVHGCVQRDAPAATWHKAIATVHAGETWIPRWLMAEALADLKQLLPAGLPAKLNLERLTERQCEIVRWVAKGLSNKEIGQRLQISPTTVKTHLQNIFERVGVHGRQQLALKALSQNVAA
jgi:DNA-binding NarL/FixJ family response regulator